MVAAGPVRAEQEQSRRALLCWVYRLGHHLRMCASMCALGSASSNGLGSSGKAGLAAVMGCQGNDRWTDAPQGFSLRAPPSTAAVLGGVQPWLVPTLFELVWHEN